MIPLEEHKKGNKKLPPQKKLDFKSCKKNTLHSLTEVEYFLNNFKKFSKYVKVFKLFK